MNQNASEGPVIFDSHDLRDALLQSSRIYLSGNLSRPQEGISPLSGTSIEMGESLYTSFTCDSPHMHTTNYEFVYIAEGETHLYDLTNDSISVLLPGSVFILKPNTPYVSKHAAGTRTVFFKAPGGNDKRLVEVPQHVTEWMSEKI